MFRRTKAPNAQEWQRHFKRWATQVWRNIRGRNHSKHRINRPQRTAEREGMRMKGIILAGGLGSRLRPLTKVTNKHLLPIYHKPMIYYPLETFGQAGIDEIMIVTGGNSAGDFLRLLGNGRDFGLHDIYYTYQE